MPNLIRFFHTVRHLRVSQIYQRIKIRWQQKIRSAARYQREYAIDTQSLRFVRYGIRDRIKRNLFKPPSTFDFLNQQRDTKKSWFPENVNPLWLYNLHYFEYLYDVEDEETYWQLISSWIDQVAPLTKAAWHPYTVSLRVCNWIVSFSARYEAQDYDKENGSLVQSFLDSLYNQTRYIADFLELDVLGNHLVENCKALIVSGVFFGNEKWLEKGLTILELQLREQILADGGHYERSPMYHCIILEDLLQIRSALVAAEKNPGFIDGAIRRMAGFLENILELDGAIPLLNDSAYGISLEPDLLLREVSGVLDIEQPHKQPVVLCKDFGLFVVRTPALSLTFDVGANCPDYLPAHAHSDQLSFTLQLDGIPIITDSGTYEYTQGKWRDLFRETASHSSIKIDGFDLIDTWSSFRVGRRGYPFGLQVDLERMVARCAIDNFRFLDVDVAREIRVLKGFLGIVVSDSYTCKNNGHRFSSYLQFHPAIDIGKEEVSNDTRKIELLLEGDIVAYCIIDPRYDIFFDTSWYSEQFGLKVERKRLRISGELPVGESTLRYALVRLKPGEEFFTDSMLRQGR